MKYLYALLAAISAWQSAFGQSYKPLIRPNTYWDVMHYAGSEICMVQDAARYFFEGDTIINGYQYHIVRGYPILQANPGPFCPPFVIHTSTSYLFALMREDTITQKVYIRDHTSWPPPLTDELLYDFSLSAGDTLHSQYASLGATLIVDSIGLVTYADGVNRRIFYLNPQGHTPATYTEGLGSSSSLFHPIMPGIGFGYGIECITDNNLHILGDNCYPILSAQDELGPEMEINVSPNPTSGEVVVKLTTATEAQFSLFTINGARVYSKQLFQVEEKLNLSHLPNGLYYYLAELKDGKRVTGRIGILR